ncbi:MAG: hypothetical protein IV110_06920 [Aquabacterium sp.]|uniref:hypothetical protein n=1 Tax=Aquabacterium sp. TaxID=1872578 RepID=UPI001DCAB354|nr:hypothetical protein [Aquabacterium sp.]MBT9609758.1 hypothetical protein [Aquabacterium sp.]
MNTPPPSTRTSARRSALAFVLLAGLVWLGLFWANKQLHYVHAGSDLIHHQKSQVLPAKPLFPPSATYRVLAFGNSKTLSAFRPDVFDAHFKGRVASFNMGLPGDSAFVGLLEYAIRHGNRPTHILLQEPWRGAAAEVERPWLIKDDRRILDTLIPFRRLPRDLTLFVFQARKSGLQAEWHRVKAEVNGMTSTRGWYFISAQSHYPNDALPDDFRLPTDTPHQTAPRKVEFAGAEYERLLALAKDHGIEVLFVPYAIRDGQAAPQADPGTQVHVTQPKVATHGPTYWTLPPSSFSDPVHLNHVGSQRYTQRLAQYLDQLGEFH